MPRKKRDEYEEDNFLDEVDGEVADEIEDEDDQEVADEDTSDDEAEPDEEEEESQKEAAKAKGRGKAKSRSRSRSKAKSEEKSEDEVEEKEEEEEEKEEEKEIGYPPDGEKAVAALQKLNVRLDVSEKGNVWRVIFDDSNGKDPALVLLNGLPALRELWLLGTRVTTEAAEEFKEAHPKITVYH